MVAAPGPILIFHQVGVVFLEPVSWILMPAKTPPPAHPFCRVNARSREPGPSWFLAPGSWRLGAWRLAPSTRG
jgi:hypothetical protein